MKREFMNKSFLQGECAFRRSILGITPPGGINNTRVLIALKARGISLQENLGVLLGYGMAAGDIGRVPLPFIGAQSWRRLAFLRNWREDYS